MAFVIAPIAPISLGSLQPSSVVGPASGASSGSDFGNVLTNALDSLSATQAKADGLALQAATGDLQSVQAYTIAATEAQLQTQLTVQVRNKALEAFNDIMKMQI